MATLNERFWVLRPPLRIRERDFALYSKKMKTGEVLICPRNREHDRGILSSTLYLIAKGDITDFIWSVFSDLTCSERIRSEIEEEGLKGLDFSPVEVERHAKGADPPGAYFQVKAVGWGGLPPASAGMELIYHCPGCQIRHYWIEDTSKVVAQGGLDGSDFFFVWPLRQIFCNDRAASWLRQKGYTGVSLLPANELHFAHPKFSPLPLDQHIGEERARELGEPLGIYDETRFTIVRR
jgi:hypothetical protein